MLKEFKGIYDLHHWVRYLSWAGLGSVTLFLLWAEGGFPPLAWRLFAQELQQFPASWATRGITALFPVAILAVLSLLWLLSWSLVLWVGFTLLWPSKRDARHIAWRESRNLNVREVLQLDEERRQEDTVNIPKLNLPYKAHIVSQATGTDSVRPTRQLILNGRASVGTEFIASFSPNDTARGRDKSVPTGGGPQATTTNTACAGFSRSCTKSTTNNTCAIYTNTTNMEQATC